MCSVPLRTEHINSDENKREPTHTGHYLHFKAGHPKHVKGSIFLYLVHRVKAICQEQSDFNREIMNVTHYIILNGYPQCFIDITIKTRRNNSSSDETSLGTVVIPYTRGISEEFQNIGNNFNSRTIFKTRCMLQVALMVTIQDGEVQQTKHCV
jgi:hypothetical protein